MLVPLTSINASNYVIIRGISRSYSSDHAECHPIGYDTMSYSISPFWGSPMTTASLRYKKLHLLSHEPHESGAIFPTNHSVRTWQLISSDNLHAQFYSCQTSEFVLGASVTSMRASYGIQQCFQARDLVRAS
jgi:hypothetical protein